jgi:26S proteasome regulatory subunit N9
MDNSANEKIFDFLSDQRNDSPAALQQYFLSFEDQWERKLWHELTDTLVTYYAEPESAPKRLPIFNCFIKTFADKINQLKLVRIGLSTANECKGDFNKLSMIYIENTV